MYAAVLNSDKNTHIHVHAITGNSRGSARVKGGESFIEFYTRSRQITYAETKHRRFSLLFCTTQAFTSRIDRRRISVAVAAVSVRFRLHYMHRELSFTFSREYIARSAVCIGRVFREYNIILSRCLCESRYC